MKMHHFLCIHIFTFLNNMAKQSTEEVGLLGAIKKYGTAINYGIAICAFVGHYYISQYKIEENEKAIQSLSARVKAAESVNYELLAKQLQGIEEANTEFRESMNATNKRIDTILELLIKTK